ncbi:MAG: ATP-binding protein [Pirellulales bacterium]
MTGAAGLLAESREKLADDVRLELAASILDEAERLNRLVANLLDLTRLEAGAIRPDLQVQPIDDVVGVVLRRLERHVAVNRIEVHIPADLPPVAIDAVLVQQLLLNLLDNALKYSPAGTPIELSGVPEGPMLAMTVADRGPGLVPGTERKIFEKFFRSEGQTQMGSGIGLAICRGIVELHGGAIIAENRAGGGAAFRFTLPLAPPHAA